MAMQGRVRDPYAAMVPAAMLVAGLSILMGWPLRQWSVVPVAALIGLAPGLHAALMRGRIHRATVVWVALVAGAVAILPWAPYVLPSESGGCTATPTAMVIPLAGAIAFTGGAAYALATVAAAKATGQSPGPGALTRGLVAGFFVMAVGLAAWIPLSNLMLAEAPVGCT